MKDQRSDRVARLQKNGLLRKLGVADLFAVGYGDLGSSIYYALGITALFSLGAAPISLFLAGLVFVCTSLTYAEMTAALAAEGGSANFARVAFNDLISFIAGWGLLLDFIVTIAISIFSVAPYLAFLFGGLQSTGLHIGFSIGLIGILYLINFFGVHHSTRISIFLTGTALFTQLLILVIAFFSGIDLIDVFKHMKINVSASWSPSWSEFWKGTAMAMVAYTGIESIASLGAETKRPIKTLPRAVMIVMTVLVTMYLGISVVGLSVMTPNQLGTTYISDPIAGIVANLPAGAKILGPWVGILAAALLFVAGNAGLMGASRLSFNMGEYYQLPGIFHKSHKRFRTPVASLAIFAILAAIVILWSRGKLHFLADLYNFGAMVAFCSAHLSLIALRIKQPHLPRPFKAPLNIKFTKEISIPLTAIIGALATFGVWLLVVFTKPDGRYLGFLWMGVGIGMYLLYRKKKKLTATGQLHLEKVKVPGYKPMEVRHILVPTKGGPETETVQLACEIAKIHGAKLTAVHLIRVPYSLPLDAPMPYRQVVAESILQRAEAIAAEFGVSMERAIVRAREIDETILQYLIEHHCDLLVLGAMKSARDPNARLGSITERILHKAPCRVFITSSAP
jgi:basic amino acid/polyamine antiporter, APA family